MSDLPPPPFSDALPGDDELLLRIDIVLKKRPDFQSNLAYMARFEPALKVGLMLLDDNVVSCSHGMLVSGDPGVDSSVKPKPVLSIAASNDIVDTTPSDVSVEPTAPRQRFSIVSPDTVLEGEVHEPMA